MKHLICLIAFLASLVVAAQAPKSEFPLEEVEYMKVEPGMDSAYLKIEAIWKKVHANRKASGEILYWHLFRRQYPSGTEAAYDYVTVTGYKNGAALEARETASMDVWLKGLTKEELAAGQNTEKTRRLVARQLDLKRSADISTGKHAKYIQSLYVKVPAANRAEYDKILVMAQPFVAEGAKAGKMASWSVYQTLYPVGGPVADFTVTYGYASLADALKHTGGMPDLATEFKKIYPAQDYATYRKRLSEVRQLVGTELWMHVMGVE